MKTKEQEIAEIYEVAEKELARLFPDLDEEVGNYFKVGCRVGYCEGYQKGIEFAEKKIKKM